MSLRAVVFDLDGTLIDSERDIAGAVNAALTALGRDALPLATVRQMIGHGARQLIASALGSDDDALIARAREIFIAHYGAHPVDQTVVYAGMRETLAALRARDLTLAIATNKPARITRIIVERLGLDLPSASADEVPARKPDPAALRLALERAGVRAGDCAASDVAYVGDMGVDVETARAFGARAVGVSWGLSPESARAASPDVWLDHPQQLIAHVDAWRARAG